MFKMLEMDGNVIIDVIGKVSHDWLLEDFKQYYEAHKDELDKIHSHTLNTHVKIYDKNGNRYKVIRRNGRTILTRVSEKMEIHKRDMIDQLIDLQRQLTELGQLIASLEKDVKTDKVRSQTDEDIVKGMLAIAEKPEPLEKYPA